jgi:hypothetical protein
MTSSVDGTLSVIMWPVYIGIARAGVTPPFSIDEPHNGGYQRGQITWTPVPPPDPRQVIGRARILCPPGEYTHFVYFHHPTKPKACGVAQLPHPIRFEVFTTLDVYPIENQDLQLARQLCP